MSPQLFMISFDYSTWHFEEFQYDTLTNGWCSGSLPVTFCMWYMTRRMHIYVYMIIYICIRHTSFRLQFFATHPSLFSSTIWIPKAHLALASALIQKGVKVGGSMIGKGRYLAWWILMKEDPQKVGIFLVLSWTWTTEPRKYFNYSGHTSWSFQSHFVGTGCFLQILTLLLPNILFHLSVYIAACLKPCKSG